MLGFDGPGRVPLRMRPHGAVNTTILTLDAKDPLTITEALYAADDVGDAAALDRGAGRGRPH
jgi:hypothetical protein